MLFCDVEGYNQEPSLSHVLTADVEDGGNINARATASFGGGAGMEAVRARSGRTPKTKVVRAIAACVRLRRAMAEGVRVAFDVVGDG